MEIAEQSNLFFVGNVHRIEIYKGDNNDAESEIHFAMLGVAHPRAADHTVASPQHNPSVAVAEMYEGWGMVNHMSL